MSVATVASMAVTGNTWSESASKALLREYGVPMADEREVSTAAEAAAAASEIGFPVVAKLCGDAIAHKTERGLVRLRLTDDDAVRAAAEELLAMATAEDGAVSLLIAPMLSGSRELIAGLATDEQFGATVVLGLGGVLAEAVADVAIRLVPITRIDALDMIDDLRCQAVLGAFRGEPPVDRERLADVLLALSAAAAAQPEVRSVDLNPLIVVDGVAVAVDALVEVAT